MLAGRVEGGQSRPSRMQATAPGAFATVKGDYVSEGPHSLLYKACLSSYERPVPEHTYSFLSSFLPLTSLCPGLMAELND